MAYIRVRQWYICRAVKLDCLPLHSVGVHSEQRTMDEFTDEEIEKLIDLVSKQCDLYDPNSRKFKSLHRRQAIWNDIGNSLNKDGAACKSQWKKLRDRYRHFKKTNIVVTDSSPAKWKQCQLMTFLDIDNQKVSARNTDANTSDACSASDAERNEQTFTNVPPNDSSTPRTKNFEEIYKYITGVRKTNPMHHSNSNNILKSQKAENDDELSSFASHVRDVLKILPRSLQIRAKKEIFQVLNIYETLACDSDSSDMSISDSNDTSNSSAPLRDLVATETHLFGHPQVSAQQHQIQSQNNPQVDFDILRDFTFQ
uniref:SFRICE_038337 n=1 Tax=Spodoptera frugiperda TaxID=7108 RepID=A0A2H1WD49_SPOFR